MTDKTCNILTTCGREVGAAELEHAREVLQLCPGLSRAELALTLCEHWGWVGATGGLQQRACNKLLEKWDKQGSLRLPEKDTSKQRLSTGSKRIVESVRTAAPRTPVDCELSQLQPVWLEPVIGSESTNLWNEFVARYHPLGCKRSIGCTLRYFVSSGRGRLGCILMGSAAVALGVRDKWIGWTRQQRLAHLPWVINNQRLLLFPWVTVPHLVSHVLGQLARRIQADWEARWGYRPVLMETFVDPAYYRGVGYRAAGWLLLGESTGRGICRGHHEYRTTQKLIFVRPLTPSFWAQLGLTETRTTQCATAEQSGKKKKQPRTSKAANTRRTAETETKVACETGGPKTRARRGAVLPQQGGAIQ